MTDNIESPEYKAGMVAGRLSAVESRLDRLEHAIDTRLSGIESKLESIASQLQQGSGMQFVGGKVLHWALTLAISVGGWLYAGTRH